MVIKWTQGPQAREERNRKKERAREMGMSDRFVAVSILESLRNELAYEEEIGSAVAEVTRAELERMEVLEREANKLLNKVLEVFEFSEEVHLPYEKVDEILIKILWGIFSVEVTGFDAMIEIKSQFVTNKEIMTNPKSNIGRAHRSTLFSKVGSERLLDALQDKQRAIQAFKILIKEFSLLGISSKYFEKILFNVKRSHELSEEEVDEMRGIYIDNYEGNEDLQEYVRRVFQEAVQKDNVSWHLLSYDDQVWGFCRFEKQEDGRYYFGSFNMNKNVQRSRLGQELLLSTIAAYDEVYAHSLLVNPITEKYLEIGFVGEGLEYIEGQPALRISRGIIEVGEKTPIAHGNFEQVIWALQRAEERGYVVTYLKRLDEDSFELQFAQKAQEQKIAA